MQQHQHPGAAPTGHRQATAPDAQNDDVNDARTDAWADALQGWPQGDALDRALSACLQPPSLPANFQQKLFAAITTQALIDTELNAQRKADFRAEQELKQRRIALEAEHQQHLAELDADYVLVRRNTVATVLAVAFTIGASATTVLPWLTRELNTDLPTLLCWGAILISLGISGQMALRRLGLIN